jgi:hypothetical protein
MMTIRDLIYSELENINFLSCFLRYDWLIDCCSTTNEQYFSYIQGENKFNDA